jgi:hypothetical protein
VPGHLFVVQGDVRRIASAAWLLPCDLHGWVSPAWLEDDMELRARVDAFRPHAIAAFQDGRRVARLPGDERPHVWMVDTGGHPGTAESWYAEGLAEFVRAAAGATKTHPNLAVVPFVGAGLGGRALDKGTLLPLLLETLAEAANHHDVDVAFVTRDRRAFGAAQAFRRREPDRYWATLSDRLTAVADRLAERVASGSLVAFLGAGASRDAGLPGWKDLLGRLATMASLEGPVADELALLNPIDQAMILEKRLGGAEALRGRIAELLSDRAYALTHALLAGLSATEFVTTNYDELFERAADAAGMPVVVLPYQGVTGSRQRWLLKLHGTVARPADIVLTREDYLRYPDRRGALAALVQALLITRQMLFVGFSLGDDNFHRIVDDVRKALGDRGADPEPFGTALMVRAPSFTQELWKNDLEIVALDEAEVAPLLDRMLAMSSTLSEFLLDESFAGFLSPEEAQLKSLLLPLQDALANGLEAPIVVPARRFLESFGSPTP